LIFCWERRSEMGDAAEGGGEREKKRMSGRSGRGGKLGEGNLTKLGVEEQSF